MVKYVGSSSEEFDRYLLIVNKDDSASYRDGGWILSEDSVCKIKEGFNTDSFNISSISSAESEDDIGKELKLSPFPYQRDIIKYCLEKQKAIIVAPCGAGKTIVGIDVFVDAKKRGLISSKAKGIIVVKSSLKVQWIKEVEKFSYLKANIIESFKNSTSGLQTKLKKLEKKLKPLLIDTIGNINEINDLSDKISEIKEQIREQFESMFINDSDLYVINFETLRDKDVRKMLHSMKDIEYIYVDEIQYIKTDTSKRTKALWEFSDIKMRFGATATPIQKNPIDAYSIAKFISPDTWKTKSSFTTRYVTYSGFGRVSGSKNEKELNQKLSQFMIVKTKEEVSKQLPSLIPITRYCSLAPAQEEMTEKLMEEIAYYKEQEKQLLQKVGAASQSEDLLKIQANIMARQTFASELAVSEELLELSDSSMAKSYITNSKSQKIELLLELLDEIIESGEKVAIFSKYQKLQSVLKREIGKRFPDIKIASAHGALNSEQRYEECYTKFQDTDEYKVLLLTDAFCEGVNLRKAKYLIEMEPADSYLVQTQRRGRIERADSVHDTVFVYQLVAENSYDEIGLKIVEKKERYDSQIIKGNL